MWGGFFKILHLGKKKKKKKKVCPEKRTYFLYQKEWKTGLGKKERYSEEQMSKRQFCQ